MLKKIIFIFLLSFLAVQPALAQSKTKIAILPFNMIAGQQQPDTLKNQITAILKEKLEKEGSEVLLSLEPLNTESWGYKNFKTNGIRLGADFTITGSIFIAGTGISIDTKLVSTYGKDGISHFYADAKGSENLYSAVSKIAKEIISQIYQKVIITDIEISGNNRIESDAVLRILETQPGDIVSPGKISDDLKKIYKMGYFDDVTAEQKTHDTGVKIIYNVVEKPTVRRVKFNGNFVYDDEELAGFVDTRTSSILNLHKINSDVKRIRLTYTEKNYHNCKVSYEITNLKNHQADIEFEIIEGNKIKVEKITFEGNNFFTDKKIKKALETEEKGFFSFFTSSGDLNEVEVKNDVIRIESLYKNNGFVDAKVSDPKIDIGTEFISIHFNIQEGEQYKTSRVELSGDIIVEKNVLLELIQIKENSLYNRDHIRQDILAITDFYSDMGFANAEVKPLIKKETESGSVEINYNVQKNDPVYFNRISISGNYKTRDKVIRREIKIEEKGLYSKSKIQQSFKKLNRLDYFEKIDLQQDKTDQVGLLDLNVKVTEKETGRFSFGGGYSSQESAFFLLEVIERNLFGKGQTGKVSAKFSQDSILYNVGFYEPYILDTPVSGGVELYKEDKEYDYYDKESIGFSGTLGYKLFDYLRIGMRYNIEDFEISNVQPEHTYMTPGSFLLSSIKPYIKYDSRDDLFMPTEGMTHSFSVEYAGEYLASDIDYTKYLAESSIFFPLFWNFTMGLHVEGGYLDDRSADTIDIDYVKFYLGGINSIRGFDKTDINGSRSGDSRIRGGEKYVQFNAEITFPLTDKYKLAGVLFYDRGDVYRTSEEIDFGDQFSSIGTGIRWNSPLGPLRIEYGWVIDGKDKKDRGDGQFEFSVGASF